MARLLVDVDGELSTVNFDEPRRRGDIVQSILLAFVTDDITGRAINTSVRLSSSLSGASGRTASSGVCGLIGRPSAVFPALDAQPYPVDATIEASGYLPTYIRTAIGPQPGFPSTFEGVTTGAVPLRRSPVQVVVRAVTVDANLVSTGVGGADVSITGIWRHTADLTNAAAAAHLVAIEAGSSAARPIGTTVSTVTLTPTAEAPRGLLVGAAAGGISVIVDRGDVAPGDVITIDGPDADRAEHASVSTVAAAADPTSPATLTLQFPLRRDHRQGASVERVAVAPTGAPDMHLTEAAVPGDVTLFVDSTAPLGAPTHVLISGGGEPPEIRTAGRYVATTDADGYARLPWLGRVAAVQFSATDGTLNAGPDTFAPDYGAARNTAHLTLS